MNVCQQVTVECPACGHVFVAVQEAGAECAACRRMLVWAELRPGADGTWRAVSDVTVRPCRLGDVGAVLELWAAARSPHATTTDDEEVVERLMASDAEALLVAEGDGRIVGVLIATWDGWRGHMYRLAVAHQERRQGIALALVRDGERRLKAKGARKVIAPVGRGDPRAEGLWAAAGYELDADVGRWGRYL